MIHFFLLAGVFGLAPDNGTAPILFPSGVADKEGKVGYVLAKGEGIQALDLKTGKSLWTSKEADAPLLALDQGRVVAYRPRKGKENVIEVVVLDKEGKVAKTLSTPLGGAVRVNSGEGYSFKARAKMQDKESILVEWDYHEGYVGGAAPPPRLLEEIAKRCGSGKLTVDLDAGKIANEKTERINIAGTPNETTIGKIKYTIADGETSSNVRARFLKATDTSGKELWKQEIRGVRVYLPRP